jgi:hypothetical protein
LAISIGPFLVGALDPADRQEFQVHLADCEPCLNELTQLAQLPGLLHRHRLSLGDRRYGGLGILRGEAGPPPDEGVDPGADGPDPP